MMVLHFTLLLLPFAICTSPTIELWQRIDRMRTRNTLDTVLNHSPYRLHYTKCVRNFKESHLSHCERATNLFSCIKNMLALDNWNKLIISSVARSMTNAFTGPLTCIKLNTTVTTTTTTQSVTIRTALLTKHTTRSTTLTPSFLAKHTTESAVFASTTRTPDTTLRTSCVLANATFENKLHINVLYTQLICTINIVVIIFLCALVISLRTAVRRVAAGIRTLFLSF